MEVVGQNEGAVTVDEYELIFRRKGDSLEAELTIGAGEKVVTITGPAEPFWIGNAVLDAQVRRFAPPTTQTPLCEIFDGRMGVTISEVSAVAYTLKKLDMVHRIGIANRLRQLVEKIAEGAKADEFTHDPEVVGQSIETGEMITRTETDWELDCRQTRWKAKTFDYINQEFADSLEQIIADINATLPEENRK